MVPADEPDVLPPDALPVDDPLPVVDPLPVWAARAPLNARAIAAILPNQKFRFIPPPCLLIDE